MNALVISWIAAATAVAGIALWALLVHGPAQYAAGGAAMALDLTSASNAAQKEVLSDAEAFRFRRIECRKRDPSVWMFDFASGECVERAAN